MAHFARVNSSNIVVRVEPVDNKYLLDENGIENEQLGIAYQNSVYGDISPDKWIQTSYNDNFRKQYAGINFTWDPVNNIFISPKPFNSWSLNNNFDWKAPVAEPINSVDTHAVSWNEDLQRWEGKRYTDEVEQIWNSNLLKLENK